VTSKENDRSAAPVTRTYLPLSFVDQAVFDAVDDTASMTLATGSAVQVNQVQVRLPEAYATAFSGEAGGPAVRFSR